MCFASEMLHVVTSAPHPEDTFFCSCLVSQIHYSSSIEIKAPDRWFILEHWTYKVL